MDTKDTIAIVGAEAPATAPVSIKDWQAMLASAVVTQPQQAPKAKATPKAKAKAQAHAAAAPSLPAPQALLDKVAGAQAAAAKAQTFAGHMAPPPATVANTPGTTTGYSIVLPLQLAAKVMAPITGTGGWQTLQALLQAACHANGDGTYTLTVAVGTVHKLASYGSKYGGGGYQSTIRWIMTLLVGQHFMGKA